MTTAILAVNPETFIFAQDSELKTTSLKIAEAFGKTHAHVLRDIEKVITQVSDIFGKSNFGLTQNEVLTPTGGVRKDKMYELTKDGFIMVVMSYTGAKAFAIKEAYINAFNLMHAKLFPKPQAQPKINFDKPKPVLTQKVYDCWYKMVEIFGNQLLNEYGTDIPEIWMEAIEELTPEQIKCGFEGIKKSRSPFTPRLPVFLAYCHEKDVVSAKHKDMELVDKKKQIVIPCESREDIFRHAEAFDMRFKIVTELLYGMKQSTEIIKGALQA